MQTAPPLATLPVSFFDRRTGLSALAVQHLRLDGRVVVVYHDASGVAAAGPLLCGIAEKLLAELADGQTLSLIETSVPEHPAEPFIYARVTLSSAGPATGVRAGGGRVVGIDAVARACGIEVREVQHTETLVCAIHRPRACAFPGFRQLALGERDRDDREVA
ncbi:MAG: hypothetical protein JF887_05235 [Candidatus Dormibacteraeota bacterium]|uniref:Uncharacterized protein n=1 Tax=Candidatus Amunia macphersoniae TaxID=3127014 RepID=A0A934KJB9_9BACT|nr:hypothetical protein [Candidatus Dormibacteraeota bacterium]